MSSRNALPPAKEMSRAKSVRKSTTISGAVASLQYAVASKVDAHLSSLTDNRSNYPAVARSCLQLNQFAGSDKTQPLHDSMYAKTTSSMFSALFQCIESHQDRRCRILAAKTLALCARATYAKLRHSPLLFHVRDGILHRLEDEVGTDVPVALCTVAMEDSDDGVSASALEALGILTLCSSSMPGTLVDDELLRQVEGIAHARRSPYAPSLSDLSDEDPSIPQMELQGRVYENVLLPRIWRLVKRILQFPSATDVLRTLPFLTSVLVHLIKLMPSTTLGMDRATYAKRWIEVDILGLVHQVVTDLILPSLQASSNGGLQYACALAGLRLAHVSPYSSWTRPVCRFSATVLVQELSAAATVVDHTLSLLASLVVALRGLPLSERMASLEVVVNEIRFLPATSLVPKSITSPSIKIGNYNRRSNRMGLLTEVALSILIDGPSEKLRSKSLKDFLSSPEVTALLISRRVKKNNHKWASNQSTGSASQADNSGDSNGAPGGKTPNEAFTSTHVAEEFVLAFCNVASAYGRVVVASGKSVKNRHAQEWLRCSMAILSSSCSACVNWKSRTSLVSSGEEEEEGNSDSLFTMLTACQAAYIRLMVETLHAVGFLSPTSSVALHLVPLSTPPHVLILEELAQSISSLARYTPIKGSQFLHQKEMTTLADQFLEYKFREGIPSRHHRIALMALVADHWVQSLDNDVSSDQAYNMNDMNARELLTLLSAEISALTKNLNEGTGDNQVNLKYLDVCVASVENIALMACDWARRHGSSANTNESFRKDIDEDVTYIVFTATAALEGKNLREMDVLDDCKSLQSQDNAYPMLPICAEAVKRIQSVSVGQQGGASYGVKPSLHSLLVTTADRDFKRRVSNTPENQMAVQYANVGRSPFISVDPEQQTDEPLVTGDASVHAYFVQYCIQLIWSRIDQSMQSSTLTDLVGTPVLSIAHDGEEKQGVVKARNWLRLAAPPKSAATPLAARVSCAGSVTTLSGASDPVTFLIAYSMRRCLRYDCEMEYKLCVTLRVHNMTAVRIPSGVRMDLRVTQQRSAFDVTDEKVGEDHVLASKTAVFKQEIKAGDQLTWEVALENWPVRGFLELHPSVTFREMDAEHVPPKMVTMTPASKEEDSSKEDRSSKKDEDTDTQHTDDHTDGGSFEERTIGDDEDETIDVILTAEPVQLSPMLAMQPCPLVFFRERGGDLNTFRFLWYQMPHRMSQMTLYPNQLPGKLIGSSSDDFGAAVARISCVSPINEYIETIGTATMGWAFMTLTGNRLLCLLVEDSIVDESGLTSQSSTLHFRADDEALLYSIMGSDTTRNVVVTSLTENKWTCESQNNDIFCS
jgi:hypothetical protein